MGLRGRSKLKEEKLFFVTTSCYKRLPIFLNDSYFKVLADSLSFVNEKYNAKLVAYVFMQNHIHLIVYFEHENKLSEYMRDFKKYTASVIRRMLQSQGSNLIDEIIYEIRKQQFKIWMDRFDDLHITQKDTLETKIEYIYNNPVKKGIVERPEKYYWSSASFYFNDSNEPIPILNYVEII